MSLTW